MKYPGRIVQKGENNSPVVEAIQNQLKLKGIRPIQVDRDFGDETESAVKLYQAKNTDPQSKPLTVDGKVGPNTWASLFGNQEVVFPPNTAPSPLALKAIAIAVAELGTKEVPDGSNGGPRVDQYLASVGLGTDHFWCMAFVYWCVEQAAKSMNRTNPLVKTGGVLAQWTGTTQKKIKQADALANFALVKPGQIFIMDYGHGKGHTGLVESVSGNRLTTLEGNTNKEGSREGNGVFRRTARTIRDINAGFIEMS